MLKRRGSIQSVDPALLTSAFRDHMKDVIAWLEAREDIPVCRVVYRRVFSDPPRSAETVRDVQELALDAEAMALQVDLSLYRKRRL